VVVVVVVVVGWLRWFGSLVEALLLVVVWLLLDLTCAGGLY
jgi:hypothetical protein